MSTNKKLKVTSATRNLGISGTNVLSGQIRPDEFIHKLSGRKAIETYREMRDNDSTIGAVMYATEQTLRDVSLKVKPADDSPEALREAEFVESILDDMEHTMDDHISEALSFLSYGFSWFEVVYKRRVGPQTRNPKKFSKYTDGRLGVRKIATRAPWTVNQFEIDQQTGDVLGIQQDGYYSLDRMAPTGDNIIPTNKSLYYRTTAINGDASGRSVLRNAFTSYTYVKNLQSIEAIAVERELHGIPVGRIPAEYLSSEASDDQVLLRNSLESALRDIKLNDQGYIILPSDLIEDQEGRAPGPRVMDVDLITANGTRSIEIDPIIRRYQHDIARSVLSEFLMLGSSAGGSYALSKSKTDLFLRALESYIQTIVDVLNKQLVERLWQLNGLDYNLMPTIVHGDVAPHELREISGFLRNLNGANIDVSGNQETIEGLMEIAELPYDGLKPSAKPDNTFVPTTEEKAKEEKE